MKTWRKICILSLLFAICGCINEDLSDCPPKINTFLKFSYYGDSNDATMFAKMIDRVTLFVFDEGGQQVYTTTIDKAELASQTYEFYLRPGKYRIVCWGNAFDGTTAITGGTALADLRVHHPNFDLSGVKIDSNDALYMGELSVTVPADGNVSGDVVFTGAHCDLNIYIEGFGIMNNPSTYAIVEVANVMPQYDLLKNAKQPFTYTYYPSTVWDAEHQMTATSLQTLLFGDDNPIIIYIKNPITGEINYEINLKEYMAENNIHIDGKNERVVSIQISFLDLGVIVTVPEWVIIEMRPEI